MGMESYSILQISLLIKLSLDAHWPAHLETTVEKNILEHHLMLKLQDLIHPGKLKHQITKLLVTRKPFAYSVHWTILFCHHLITLSRLFRLKKK